MDTLPEEPRPHETAANLLSWSLAAIAICLTVVTLIQLSDKSEERLIDEALAGLSVLFSVSALLNFAYLYFAKKKAFIRLSKVLFMLGLLSLLLSGVLLVIGF